MATNRAIAALLAGVGLFSSAYAETTLEEKITILSEEVDKLRTQVEKQQSSGATGHDNDTGATTLGGYGELHFNNLENRKDGSNKDEIDFHRFVLFIGHRFSESIRFYSEVEIEHAFIEDNTGGTGSPGEVELAGIDLQRASVEVKLRVPNPPAYLRQDMTVSVDIETAMRPGALVAPVASIQGLYGGSPWVMKAENGRAVRRTVKTGIVSGGKAEVLEGLNDGDLVIPAAATVKDGARIRPQSKRSQAK